MVKKISILLLLMFFSSGICQKNNARMDNLQNFDQQQLHFGYFIGFNQYNYKLDYKANPKYSTWVEESLGINIGLIGDFRISQHLNLRFEPGLHTNKLNLIFNERSKFTQNSDTLRSVKSTYIHLPLLLKFSAKRMNNFRPYLLGGVSTSINLSSNQNSPEDNKNNVFRLKSNSLYYEFGFGIDFYLQYFKFSPSIRGLFSLKDELVPDENSESPWTGNIDKLSTRGVFINLTFH